MEKSQRTIHWLCFSWREHKGKRFHNLSREEEDSTLSEELLNNNGRLQWERSSHREPGGHRDSQDIFPKQRNANKAWTHLLPAPQTRCTHLWSQPSRCWHRMPELRIKNLSQQNLSDGIYYSSSNRKCQSSFHSHVLASVSLCGRPCTLPLSQCLQRYLHFDLPQPQSLTPPHQMEILDSYIWSADKDHSAMA